MVIGAVIVSVLLTLVFQASNLFTLVATFVDDHRGDAVLHRSGNLFFARLKARRSRL